jgi:GGDEF domain-containing protein
VRTPRYAPLVGERAGLRSFAAVPIELSDGTRVGAVSLMHAEADAFRPHDLEVLDTAARRLARAVEAETAAMSEATRAHHLRRIVHHDDLTGTLNVHGFYEAVEQATERESRLDRPAWLVCARLEGVERLTVQLGRAMEGLILRDLVGALRAGGEPTDELGRIGEHEIAVLLTPGQDERRTAKFCSDAEARFHELAARRGVDPVLEITTIPLDALHGALAV